MRKRKLKSPFQEGVFDWFKWRRGIRVVRVGVSVEVAGVSRPLYGWFIKLHANFFCDKSLPVNINEPPMLFHILNSILEHPQSFCDICGQE